MYSNDEPTCVKYNFLLAKSALFMHRCLFDEHMFGRRGA